MHEQQPLLLLIRIFSLLSAILHLGNIRYKKKTYRDDSIDICNPEVLPIISELLEVSSGTALTQHCYTPPCTSHEVVHIYI